MWQNANRATLGYSSNITTLWELKVLARYTQNQNQFVKEKIKVTIWVTNLQFWMIHD